jgi:histidinol-phosphate/aromatic aminotransferase/cobyric acid decarboxylase-like protein
VPSDTVVLLDEAHVEFVAPEHRFDAAALVRRFPNVVVLRRFSKAYGLAGLRIGYGLGGAGPGQDAVDDAAAVRDEHHRRGRGRRLL